MQGIICNKIGALTLESFAMPTLQAGETLLKIHRVGICGTDLHAFAGNQAYFSYPRILGHELAAEVLEINGESYGLQIGNHVVVIPYQHCGTCIACRQGKTNCCANIKVFGVHIDGGMRQYIAYPTHLLLKGDGLSLDEMALVEPLAIGAHAVRRAAVQPGEFALVMGCGPIGIGVMRLLQLAGANVIALDVNLERLEFCQNKLGIQHIVQANEHAVQQVLDITKGDLATAVFDATGNKNALEGGIQFMAHGGRYVLIGLSKGDLTFHHPSIHAKETTLLCSRNATRADFEQVMEILQKKEFPVATYISQRVPFQDIITSFPNWTKPEANIIKVMTIW
jgi:2-desacetyl-2-hydroxyethyl bacteriochlorophyllide A dehydrogenase